MQDVANIWLVDPHTERARRDHDQAPGALHEQALGGGPFAGTHLAVILHDRDARPPEGTRKQVNRRRGGAVNDSGPTQRPDALPGGANLLRTGHDLHRQAQVLSVRRGDQDSWIAQAKPLGDVLANMRRRGSGERERRRVAQPLTCGAEPQVGRSEIMAPLRNAMSFVYAKQRRSSLLETG